MRPADRGLTWGFMGIFAVAPLMADAGAAGDGCGLEGTWEGFIAETPARLTRIGVELKRAGESWEGTIDLPGVEGLPLSAIRVEGSDLHFELRAGETLVVFDAEHVAESISGRVVEGERTFTFDLRKLPVYPKPANRVEAREQDLDVVRSRFLRYDRSFTPETRAAFEKALDRLEASGPGPPTAAGACIR